MFVDDNTQYRHLKKNLNVFQWKNPIDASFMKSPASAELMWSSC